MVHFSCDSSSIGNDISQSVVTDLKYVKMHFNYHCNCKRYMKMIMYDRQRTLFIWHVRHNVLSVTIKNSSISYEISFFH